jgi:hypothetical protein
VLGWADVPVPPALLLVLVPLMLCSLLRKDPYDFCQAQ